MYIYIYIYIYNIYIYIYIYTYRPPVRGGGAVSVYCRIVSGAFLFGGTACGRPSCIFDMFV